MHPFSLSRTWRLLTVVLSLCALLFTQSALAGYACEAAAKAVRVAEMAEAGMPCAESMANPMDDEQPALCHAHCQSAQATSDSPQLPAVLNLAHLAAVFTVLLPSPAGSAPSPTLVQQSLLRRDATPSVAIANCCFRT